MALTALLSDHPGVPQAFARAVGPACRVVSTTRWCTLLRLIRERPIATSVFDVSAIPAELAPEEALADLRLRFPRHGLVALFHREVDPVRLFRLGRAGIPNLILLGTEDLDRAAPRAIEGAAEGGATVLVSRALSPYLTRRAAQALRSAMDGVDRRWSSEDFAATVGFSRPFLSEQLQLSGLPSVGQLLIWTRLLHAGFWLEEPGRTGESIARQLEYSSGAAFRRSLRMMTGATPTQVARGGGLNFVLGRFMDACGFAHIGSRVSAA